MNRFIHLFLFLIFILGACTPSLSATDVAPAPPTLTLSLHTETPSPIATTTSILTSLSSLTPTITPTLTRLNQSIVDLPIATPAYNQCDRMDTQKVFATDYAVYDAIKTLDPIADGFAEAMEQQWIDANGNTLSCAISLWFYIDNKIVVDFKDYETLGSWIISVMNLLDTFPRYEYIRHYRK